MMISHGKVIKLLLTNEKKLLKIIDHGKVIKLLLTNGKTTVMTI